MAALDELIQHHPRLFRGEFPAIASWVPEGWAPLVEELFRKLEAMLAYSGERDRRFRSIVTGSAA